MSFLSLSNVQQPSPNQTPYRASSTDSMPPPPPPGQPNPSAVSSRMAHFVRPHFSSTVRQTPSPRTFASQPYPNTITPVPPHLPFLTSSSSSFPQPTMTATSSYAASPPRPLVITTFSVPFTNLPPARFKCINTLDHLEKICSDLKQLQGVLLKWANDADQKLINKKIKTLRSEINEMRLTFLQITKDFSSLVPSAIYRQFSILVLVTQLVSLRLEGDKEVEKSCEELKNELSSLDEDFHLQQDQLQDLELNSLCLRNQALDSMMVNFQSTQPTQFLYAIQSTVDSITHLLSILENWTLQEIAITKAATDLSAPLPLSPPISPPSSQISTYLSSLDSSRRDNPALFDPFNQDEKTPPPH